MSFENPATLKVGMTGTFSGITYRVLGRSVMGVVDDGTTYYWNEFNLQSDSGQATTLVYEVTDNAPEWRLFTMFDPQFPITAADAANKRVGDPLNLDGTDVRVTLLDQSRVYYIEGQAPEGEDVGDRAQYFNAEAGSKMIVVSWTGDEVECYHGVTVSASVVAKAFNLPTASLSNLSNFTLSGTPPSSSSSSFPIIAAGGIIFFILFVAAIAPTRTILQSRSVTTITTHVTAPDAHLPIGSAGKIDGKNYTVVSDTLVELTEVGVVFQRHEFHLRDQDGNGALLIRGWKPGDKDWCLLTLRDPSTLMTPQQAAALQSGQKLAFSDVSVPVDTLFRFITLKVNTTDALQSATGKVFYGFSGGTGVTLMLTRWDEDNINFYEGHSLTADPTSSFTAPLEK
jgi:hypothetical protein